MTQEDFRETLSRARDELAQKLRERDEAEIRIAQLKRIIAGVADYVDEIWENSEEGEGALGIKETSLKGAIRTALRAIGKPATVTDVREMLKELRFNIEGHKNPAGSIQNVLTRLIDDGEVSYGTPRDGRRTYVWVLPTYGSPSSLANHMADVERDKRKRSSAGSGKMAPRTRFPKK
jgi:hypothetical protein